MSVRCLSRDEAVEVQFRLPADAPVPACVVGEFNDWTAGATPLHWDGDALVAAVAVAPGRRYRFRYLLEGGRWENDPDADGEEPNGFGTTDSVVDVSGYGGDSAAFRPAEPGTLAEQRPLKDADGDDIRMYTGEPVETEDGWIVPEQMNVGRDNMAGDGEWPEG